MLWEGELRMGWFAPLLGHGGARGAAGGGEWRRRDGRGMGAGGVGGLLSEARALEGWLMGVVCRCWCSGGLDDGEGLVSGGMLGGVGEADGMMRVWGERVLECVGCI